MPRRLKIRRSEHSEGIKMPKMEKPTHRLHHRIDYRNGILHLIWCCLCLALSEFHPEMGDFGCFSEKYGVWQGWKVGGYYIFTTNRTDF